MKIINTVFGNAQGGRWQIFCDYARILSELGHSLVNIYQTSNAKENYQGINPVGKIINIRNSGHYDPFATIVAFRIIRNQAPDFIISHSSRSTYLFKRASRNVPVISVCHSSKVSRMLKGDHIIAISDEIEKKSSSHPSVFRLNNPINNFATKIFTNKLSPRLCTFGFFARLEEDKGLIDLLIALKNLDKKKSKWKLIIGGSGSLSQTLIDFISSENWQNKVTYMGWVNEPETFYKEIDILVFPSHREASPLTPIEAAKLGIPLILSNLPPITETFTNWENAIIFQRKNVEELTAALDFSLQNRHLLDNMAASAKRVVDHLFSPEKFRHELIEILNKVIRQKSNMPSNKK